MMNKEERSALIAALSNVVRDVVAKAEDKISKWVSGELKALTDLFEERIQKIPEGRTGERGEKGEQGERGDPGESIKGEKGDKGETGERGEVGAKGEPGAIGPKGDKGDPGESIRGEKGEIGPPGESIRGERGEKGEKGDRGDMGRDGRDGIGKDGRDGEPGRDALAIDILPMIDPTKSYPRGTYGCALGGLWWAPRNTNPAENLLQGGWQILLNGIAFEEPIHSEDKRNFGFIRTFSNGEKLTIDRYLPVPLFKGIWREGVEWKEADIVQRNGSMWICNLTGTKGDPGNSPDWTLCTKHGRDGKDGKNGERGLPGPEGRPGRDLTQIAPNGAKH